jgi:hypothetical protein
MTKAPKSFPCFALGRIGAEERLQLGDDRFVVEVFGIELTEPPAVESGARPFACEADLGEKGRAQPFGHARIVQKGRNGCSQGKLPSPRTYFAVCP